MKKSLFLLALLTLLFSCGKTIHHEKIKQATWLLGSWENKMADGTIYETWKKVNDSTYEGVSYFIKGKDTLHDESMNLLQKGDSLIYSSTVEGQDNDLPISFLASKITATQLVFENAKHDYPQKIEYRQIKNDSIVAVISGKQQNKASSEAYPMKKIY